MTCAWRARHGRRSQQRSNATVLDIKAEAERRDAAALAVLRLAPAALALADRVAALQREMADLGAALLWATTTASWTPRACRATRRGRRDPSRGHGRAASARITVHDMEGADLRRSGRPAVAAGIRSTEAGRAGTVAGVTAPTIMEAMDHEALFGPHFKGASWAPWRAFLAALFGLPMDDAARRSTASTLAGRRPRQRLSGLRH